MVYSPVVSDETFVLRKLKVFKRFLILNSRNIVKLKPTLVKLKLSPTSHTYLTSVKNTKKIVQLKYIVLKAFEFPFVFVIFKA